MRLRAYQIICCTCLSLLLGGCSNDFSGDRYDENTVGEISRTETGTIVSMRKVELKPDGSKSSSGAVVGAVGGGLVGSMFGKGGGKLLSTVAGAALGGVAGNAVQNSTQDGCEYTVKLDSGSVISLAQGIPPKLSVGQRVRVIESGKGRSRVVPE